LSEWRGSEVDSVWWIARRLEATLSSRELNGSAAADSNMAEAALGNAAITLQL
jgi:hypothetical protein